MTVDLQIKGLDIWGDDCDLSDHDATPLTLPVSIHTRVETQAEATKRWRINGIGEQVAAFRDQARADYIADHPGCKRRDAHNHAWARAMAEFPPPGIEPPAVVELEPPEPEPAPVAPDPPAADTPSTSDQAAPAGPAASPSSTATAGVQGLGDIPADWPALPANASLPAEVSWVQANRLRVVQAGAVDLSRALSPAPSHAALGWLETSILYPSKFADVAVKASADHQDDQEDVRRERIALADVQALLAEAMATTATS